MYKKKITLKVSQEEVAIVWGKENWEHLVTLYEAAADAAYPGERDYWYEAADYIRKNLRRAEKSFDDKEVRYSATGDD